MTRQLGKLPPFRPGGPLEANRLISRVNDLSRRTLAQPEQEDPPKEEEDEQVETEVWTAIDATTQVVDIEGVEVTRFVTVTYRRPGLPDIQLNHADILYILDAIGG